MANKKGTFKRGEIVEGKRYCRGCNELHALTFDCENYGLREHAAVKKYIKEINAQANQLMQRKPK